MDTEDLFALLTQPIPNDIRPTGKPNAVEDDNDDAFDAPTQRLPTATTAESTFAKPIEPAKKKRSIVAHNDSGNPFGIESIDD